MLTVSVLGSCRVFKPIDFARQQGKVRVGHADAAWYTHTTTDVLQKVEIVRGLRTPPDHLVPLIAHVPTLFRPKTHRADFYADTDVFIIEISSLNVFPYEDWFLQQVCFKRAKTREMDECAYEIAASIRRVQLSEKEVIWGLEAICASLVKPVLFVNHLCVEKDDGKRFEERERIRTLVAQFCERDRRASAFDPTAIVQEVGVDLAMTDPNHYSANFEREVLGDRLVSAAEAVFTRRGRNPAGV